MGERLIGSARQFEIEQIASDHELLSGILQDTEITADERNKRMGYFRRAYLADHSLIEYGTFLVGVSRDIAEFTDVDAHMDRLKDGR